LSIDGCEVEVPAGTTIWEAARSRGTGVPVLCHDPRLDPVAVCRVCAVEVEGARTLVASCIRQCEPGMKVKTAGARVEQPRRILIELLMADHTSPCVKERRQPGSCELERQAREMGVTTPRFPARHRD